VGGADELYHAERLVFVRFNFLASLWSEAMNSLWVEKGPWTRPALMSPDLCTRAAPRGHPERTERTGDPGIRRESDGLELFLVLHPKAIAVTPRVCGKEEPRTQRPAKRSSRT
jgi:hypothetical protein